METKRRFNETNAKLNQITCMMCMVILVNDTSEVTIENNPVRHTLPLWWEFSVCLFHPHHPGAQSHVTDPPVVWCKYGDSSSVPQSERLAAEQCWQHSPSLHPEAHKITSMLMLCLSNSGSLSLEAAYTAAVARQALQSVPAALIIWSQLNSLDAAKGKDFIYCNWTLVQTLEHETMAQSLWNYQAFLFSCFQPARNRLHY